MIEKPLQHVSEPKLYEDMFPYHDVPRITFDGKIHEDIDGRRVTFDPSEALRRELLISDTTFRDGQQSRPPYSPEQIAAIYEMLSRLSGPRGIIRFTEFFLYSKKDREAVEKCRALDRSHPIITGWIRAEPGDFRLVKEMELPETGILTSCSDYHVFHKLKKDRRKAFDDYTRVVEMALEEGVRVRCHLEDVTRADIDGFVLPFVQKLMRMSEELPEDLRVKIRLCDTLGYGVTYPGSALPRSIPKLIYKIRHEGGVPSHRLEWHGHNDFHKVHVNAASCWLYGCDVVNTTFLGIGERTGNPPLEAAVFEYMALKGTADGMDPMVITELADYAEKNLGIRIPANQPFVGDDFNVTRAGIHAGGLFRDERIYNVFDTARILGRPPRVSITDKSGVEGILYWVNDFLGLSDGEKVGKLDVVKIARWINDQYEVHHRTTAISDEELAEQVRIHMPEHHEQMMKRRKTGRKT